MKTPRYQDTIRWIANENEPTDLDEKADLFDRTQEQVAADVVAYRKTC